MRSPKFMCTWPHRPLPGKFCYHVHMNEKRDAHMSIRHPTYPPYDHIHDRNLSSCAHGRKLYQSFPPHRTVFMAFLIWSCKRPCDTLFCIHAVIWLVHDYFHRPLDQLHGYITKNALITYHNQVHMATLLKIHLVCIHCHMTTHMTRHATCPNNVTDTWRNTWPLCITINMADLILLVTTGAMMLAMTSIAWPNDHSRICIQSSSITSHCACSYFDCANYAVCWPGALPFRAIERHPFFIHFQGIVRKWLFCDFTYVHSLHFFFGGSSEIGGRIIWLFQMTCTF